jgi:hypothetical protein
MKGIDPGDFKSIGLKIAAYDHTSFQRFTQDTTLIFKKYKTTLKNWPGTSFGNRLIRKNLGVEPCTCVAFPLPNKSP